MKPSNTIIVSPKYIEEKEHQIADLGKTIERLQDDNKKLKEQIESANKTIFGIANTDGSDAKTILDTVQRDAGLYLEKWGVK